MPRFNKFLALPLLLAATNLPVMAEGSAVAPMAEPLFRVGALPVTNSMVMSWVVAIALIIVIRIAAGKPKLIPSRGQAMVERLMESLMEVLEPIVGSKAIKASRPLLIGLFTFILIQNWSSLIPGVGTIFMRSHVTGEWMELARPGNADMNGTFALAGVSLIVGTWIILRYAGVKAILFDIFGNKADKRDVPAALYYPMFLVFFAAGLLDVISIMVRPFSLSFRLYGNIFGGENLLHSMSAICKWGLPVPFYFMELLVGVVQALVFTLLVSVYIGLICNHEGGGDHSETSH